MAKEQLKVEGKKFNDNILVGMIEVPAAAIALPHVLAKSSTSCPLVLMTLIQYTLAIDRTDDTVAHLYDPLHPAGTASYR
jgi:phosphotransferase system enzyme I (PtsI)